MRGRGVKEGVADDGGWSKTIELPPVAVSGALLLLPCSRQIARHKMLFCTRQLSSSSLFRPNHSLDTHRPSLPLNKGAFPSHPNRPKDARTLDRLTWEKQEDGVR